MSDSNASDFVLGVDLGTNSLGWAIIGLVDGEPHHLVRTGVRVFEAGMDGDVASGREESRNLKRRQMRSQRRQTWRRARRAGKIFNLLQKYQLLPAGDASSSEGRQEFLNRLDRAILTSSWFQAKRKSGLYPEPDHVMPYVLRAVALDEPLEPFFLGRALYHLAQRRGFLSNRKQAAKAGDDEGVVKEGIAGLRKAMQEAAARTLGEYFSRLSPSAERIRSRWTARDIFEKEFEAIWAAQAPRHPHLLTDDRKKELRRAIFFQRPLWFDPNTIGRCELEPDERRAPAYLLLSQRFRFLDKVNNLRINEANLTADDRAKLIQKLELHGDITFKNLRKELKLAKDDEINLERGGETKLPGNRTFAKFHKALGQPWLDLSDDDRNRLVQYAYAFEKPAKLAEAARSKWNLDEVSATALSEIAFEPDYLNLSVKAMKRLLPLLEQGKSYSEARKHAYPESFESGEAIALLPPVDRALTQIRNPAVMRSLTELRKVVNAIVRQYGKPAYIRVELARDLKKSRKQRLAISESNRRNEASRSKAAQGIMNAQVGIAQPKPDAIRKYLLAEECRWQCPYTGKAISVRDLLGPEPQFDIEHIIPFSISMDNSFQNLTLCEVAENRNSKGNKTPFQAYSGDPDRYQRILERVRHFIGDRATLNAKLRRFQLDDEQLEQYLGDFRDRQLNDTAYATSLAARYLGLLYGGVNDSSGTKRVQATSGQATAYFRSLWQLNAILNDGPTTAGGYKPKSRDDHRHHAVDALVIGLTDAGMMKRLADAAQRAPQEHRRKFASLEAPWHNFVDSVRAEVEKIIVSHRVSRKVSGALHEETIYSAPHADGKVRFRKPLSKLTKGEVDAIADAGVKKLVREKLDEARGTDPSKIFSAPENLPRFASSGVLIKNVRITVAERTMPIGHGASRRHVASGNNHHVEVYAELDERGEEVAWDAEVVSMFEAHQRLRARSAVVQKNHGPLVTFKFSLAKGDTIVLREAGGSERLFVVKKLGNQVSLIGINDARPITKYFSPRINGLFQRRMRKLTVNALGELSEAHD